MEEPCNPTTSAAYAMVTITPEAYASSHMSRAGMGEDATPRNTPPWNRTTPLTIRDRAIATHRQPQDTEVMLAAGSANAEEEMGAGTQPPPDTHLTKTQPINPSDPNEYIPRIDTTRTT